MGRCLLLTPLLLASAALLDPTDAAALFRCGGGIVGPADSLDRVAQVCGEPDERFEWEVVRSHQVRHGDRCETVTTVVRMKRWVFDFGPGRLVQALTFADGALVDIHAQGYGRPQRVRDAGPSDRRWTLMPTVAKRLRRIDGRT